MPCLYKADEISFTSGNKQVGGGGCWGGCDKVERAENGFGNSWLADWQWGRWYLPESP